MLQTLAARLIDGRLQWTRAMIDAGFSHGANSPEGWVAGALVTGDGDRTSIWLSGEHDLASTVLLTSALAEALAAEEDVVVDMTHLAFMDMTTLGLLLRGREFLASRGRRLTVRNPPRCARLLLDLSELGAAIEPPDTGTGAGGSAHATTALETWVTVPPAERETRAAPLHEERDDPEVARPMSEP